MKKLEGVSMRSLVGAAALLALLGAGCSYRECGSGTVQDGNTCRAVDPDDKKPPQVTVDPPARTRTVGTVSLTSDEPATIYYTTDGTTPTTQSANEPDRVVLPGMPDDARVTFFAVDRAGNASPITEMTWEIDRTGPRPRRLSLSLSGEQRSLEWEAPGNDDLAGILLARVDGRLLAQPEPERSYVAGDEIAPGITVVDAQSVMPEATGTFEESLPPSALVRYAAWAMDDLGNYGPPVVDFEVQPLLAQTGLVSIDVAKGTVAFPAQPAGFTVSGEALLDGTTLTLRLGLQNNLARVVFAPKLVLTSIQGTTGTWDNSDGSIDNNEFRSYGGAIAPGSLLTRNLTFLNVGPDDVITAGFSIESSRVLGTSFWTSDSGGSVTDEGVRDTAALLGPPPAAIGPTGELSLRSGGITPDGHYVMGARNVGRVFTYDLTTGEATVGTVLGAQKASTTRLVMDPMGTTVYVLLLIGHPYSHRLDESQEAGSAFLVRLDAGTLTENGRLDLGAARPSSDLRLSPDGRFLSVVTRTDDVVIVDLENWDIFKRIPSPGARAAAWFQDGTRLAVVTNSEVRIHDAVIGFPEAMSAIPLPQMQSASPTMRAAFATDGRLWVGRRDQTQLVDLSTGVTLEIDVDGVTLERYDGRIYLAGSGDSSVSMMTNSGIVETTYSFDNSNYGHHVARSPF